MATEREEIRYDGGRGGKFQKRSGRRTHSTPYDRPPTAIRNPTGNGWLSKLVDPAQKLIVSGAHRLFSTVFSKRLLPPPPPPPLPLSREANGEMESKNQEAVPTDPRVIQGTSALDVAPSINSNTHAVTDLEQILKEKTFTRCSSFCFSNGLLEGAGFGIISTDYMYVMKCSQGGNFSKGELQRYGNIELNPSAGVLNYGQGLFEGLKAYRKEDGSILLFRPEENASRMRMGAERMCMPSPTVDQFVEAVKATVLANKRWVPPSGKGSLYIRPLLMGSGAVLGLAPAPEYTFLIYVSPVGNYFKEGIAPIHLIVEHELHRATPGGTGGVKTIGNYAAVLKAQSAAKANGSEINRLTELLNSRIVNVPSGVEERKSELVPYTPLSSRGRTDVSLKFPAQDGFGTPVVSSHIERSNVLEEDVASPAEIAKAYMGSRPLKATPSVMVSHSQTLGDNFAVSSNPPKLSSVSLVQRSSGNVDLIENGFVTPRSRGRSALYSMARMPYSRVRATPSLKRNVDSTDAYRATTSSSSQLPWEQGRLLGSKPEGALKRRSLGLDNEMGSVGPIRRIRQKSNLLSPKGHNNDTVPSSSFRPIPLRSSEMASKILEQLDKLTPPKEKISELKPLSVRNNSPTKLSPSMLHGPALRSLEDVNSPKYLENDQDTRLNDARDFTSQKNDRVGESSSLKFKVPYEKSIISAGDGISSTVLTKDLISSSTVPISSITTPSQRKWAFQMSAHEDFVDLDEEGHSNGVATDILAERREQFDGPLGGKKPSGIEAITVEKPHTSTEVKASIFSELNQVSDHGKSDVSVATEKSTGFSFPTSASSSLTVNAIGPESTLRSEKLVSSEVPTVTPPIFSSGDKLPSQKETIASVPSFTFGGKITPANEQNAVPILTFGDNIPPTQLTTVPTTLNFGEKVTFPISANTVTENGNKNAVSQFKYSSSLVNEKESANVGGAVVFKAESSGSLPSFVVSKESMSDKADNKNSSAGLTAVTPQNVFFSSVSASTPTPTGPTPTPTPSIFSFVSNGNNSNLNNGSFVSTTSSFFPAPTSSFSNNITNQNPSTKPSLTAATSSSESITVTSPSTSVPIPAFSATPILKFESSTDPSTSVSPVSALTAVESVETKTKQETTFGNLSGSLPSGTSSKMSSTGSVYQFGAAVTASDANKRSESSTFVSGNVPVFGAPLLPAGGSGIASSTQSMPMQFGSSSSTSFGLTGNSAVSSGSSLFASSAPASNLFNSGSTFGLLSSSSSAANSVSSSAGTGSSYFPNTWQSSSAPLFSTTAFNPSTSTGFSFGLLSSTNSASMPFGSSTSASTSSVFSFTSAAATASPQPVFGSNQAFGFASNSPVNNDQVNMMDSMAEDTVQTIVPTPVFGQQPLSPPPSSGCIFGSTPPMGASPFQFGSQPNIPTPQNPSPFQASGSLDFNASGGGNFSLGAGGGDKSNRKYVKVKSKSRKK